MAFRHPLTREVAYGTQLADSRAATHAAAARAIIKLNPERHDELSALIAGHLREGGEAREAARWSARAAYWAGHSRPRESLRLWQAVSELTDAMEEDEEVAALAINSRLLQLQYAWRVGMSAEEQARLAAEVEQIATRHNDLYSRALLRVATSVRPGLPHEAKAWLAAVEETVALADESGDPHLQVAVRAAGAYAYLCTADFDAYEQMLDEVLELAQGDRTVGAGVILSSPTAWAVMGKGMVRRERGEYDEAEDLFERALRLTAEEDDPETASWVRSNQAGLRAVRGDVEGGLAIARRNCELTERLGDVFSRSLALANLAWALLAAEDYANSLASIEEAERLYREAMDNGGEMAAWRAQMRAQALTGLGRAEEAIEVSEWAIATAREQGMLWAYPIANLALARALVAAGREGAEEALAEGARVARKTRALSLLRDIEAERERIQAGAGERA